MRRRSLISSLSHVSTAVAVFTLTACATGPDAQWVDPQRGKVSFAGSKVLVVCDAYEPVVKQICRDELARQVRERGGQPVFPPEFASPSPWRPVSATDMLPAARTAGAAAVLSAVVQPGIASTRSGPSIGVGLGGFSIGGGGGGIGVGVSAPLGSGQTDAGYEANGVITDVASGRLLWTAKVSTSSGDLSAQIAMLAKRLVDAAGKSGLI